MRKLKPSNRVFIATSLDGYIADSNGGIEWLHQTPNPEQNDMGYAEFMKGIDAIVMGRGTFETVLGFDIPWPYTKPVFVLSQSLRAVSRELKDRVFFKRGRLKDVLKDIHAQGFHHLYIDGGKTIQSFLAEDLIDQMTITRIPVLLGAGIPLFGPLNHPLEFTCVDTRIYLNAIVQNTFIRNTSIQK